jgi:transcriptional regulator
MYIPKHFKINDTNQLYDFIEENSFATLVSEHDGGPYATHIPLTLDRESGVLYGHFARPNGQWKDMSDKEVLVIFHGPHSYISPSWYETHDAVPTWNYTAVHVYGQTVMIEDNNELMRRLDDLVKKYEGPNSSYQLENVDPSYVTGLAKGIVGFKINITKIEGKMKLSQNHPEERRKLVIQQLEQSGAEGSKKIAKLMRDTLKVD